MDLSQYTPVYNYVILSTHFVGSSRDMVMKNKIYVFLKINFDYFVKGVQVNGLYAVDYEQWLL